jgi:diguanylate cyclase (GGDEF)-like protein/PAS domain S-box-containing protein
MLDLHDPEILRTVLETLQTGVAVFDPEGRVLFWNDGAERITGYLRPEVVGQLCRVNRVAECETPANSLSAALSPAVAATQDGSPRCLEVYLRHKAGHLIPVHVRIVPLRGAHGTIVGAVESFEQHPSTADLDVRLNSLAAHGCLDRVSGLPNHAFTQSHLRETLATCNEYHLPFGILLIEVDGFPHLLQAHGRQGAEAVAHMVADAATHILSPADFVGRWTEDRFLAILGDSSIAGVERAAEAVERVVKASTITWWGDVLSATVSVGRGLAAPGDTNESLLERTEHSLRARGQQEVASSPKDRPEGTHRTSKN